MGSAIAAHDTATAQRPEFSRPLPKLLVVGLYFVALAGRFTLDRIGLPSLAFGDIQIIGGAGILVATFAWRFGSPLRHYYHRWATGIRLSCLFVGYLALSALWSPLTPFTITVLIDLLVLLGLMVATATLTGPDPKGAAEILTWLLYGTGIMYAFGALALGTTTVQGRLTFVGGGPNVFVRVVLLGALAAVALAIAKRKPLLLLPVPVLCYAGVLSGSRGGLVAAAATIPLMLYAFRKQIRTTVAVVVALGPPLIGVLMYTSTAGSSVVERVNELFEGRGLSERDRLLAAAYELFTEEPWFGTGIGGFYEQYGRETSLEYPHNFIAAVGAETGLVGLVLLVIALGAVLSRMRYISRLSPEQICCFLAAAFLGVASLISGDYYDTRFFWIFVIVVVNFSVQPGSVLAAASPGRAPLAPDGPLPDPDPGPAAAPAAPRAEDEAPTRQMSLAELAVAGNLAARDSTGVTGAEVAPSVAAPPAAANGLASREAPARTVDPDDDAPTTTMSRRDLAEAAAAGRPGATASPNPSDAAVSDAAVSDAAVSDAAAEPDPAADKPAADDAAAEDAAAEDPTRLMSISELNAAAGPSAADDADGAEGSADGEAPTRTIRRPTQL